MGRYPKQQEEIGAFEAKTHLSELLRETERGRSYLIKRRGKAVARLVPPAGTGETDWELIRSEFDAVRRKVRGRVSVKNLIEEGRRA